MRGIRGTRGSSRSAAIFGAATTVAVFAVVLLAVLPVASAAPPKAIVKFAAPYVGAIAFDHAPHIQTGCGGSTAIGTYPTFNQSNGQEQWSISATETACTAPSAGTDTQYVKSGLTNLSFTVASNGTYNFTAHWVANGTFNYSVAYSSPNSTGLTISYRVAPVLCLVDELSNVSTCRTAAVHVVSFSSGSGSVAVAFSIIQTFKNAALTAGVPYSFAAYLYAHVAASASSLAPAGSSATGALNFVGTNHDAALTEVKVFP